MDSTSFNPDLVNAETAYRLDRATREIRLDHRRQRGERAPAKPQHVRRAFRPRPAT